MWIDKGASVINQLVCWLVIMLQPLLVCPLVGHHMLAISQSLGLANGLMD